MTDPSPIGDSGGDARRGRSDEDDTSLHVVRLGEVPYDVATSVQLRMRDARRAQQIGDHVLLLSHPHTLTAGTRGGKPDRWANLLAERAELEARGVAFREVDRGGDVTYHGPGQLVIYPILHLDAFRRDVGHYVWKLEETSILTLDTLGITAHRQPGYPGVWIGPEKIAAIGARVRGWVTTHGTALNLRGPLEGFDWIIPCGLQGRGVTSVARQLPGAAAPPSDDAILNLVTDALAAVFDRRTRTSEMTPQALLDSLPPLPTEG